MAQTPKTIEVDVGQIDNLIRRSFDDMQYWKGQAEKAEVALGELREAVLRFRRECDTKAPFYDSDLYIEMRRNLFAVFDRQVASQEKVTVITQRELELGQENQALRAYLQIAEQKLSDLVSGLKMWMVGWRDDLAPEARAQMEAMIREHEQ